MDPSKLSGKEYRDWRNGLMLEFRAKGFSYRRIGELFGMSEGGAFYALKVAYPDILRTDHAPAAEFNTPAPGPLFEAKTFDPWSDKPSKGEFWNAPPQQPDVLRSDMDFGRALRQLKLGRKIARKGWNGKGMWLSLSGLLSGRRIDHSQFWSANNADFAAEQPDSAANVLPCITMKTADGSILMGWLASQTDILAEDWEVVR